MIGWVAKDDHSYGYSVKKYGPQKGTRAGQSRRRQRRRQGRQADRATIRRDTSVAVGRRSSSARRCASSSSTPARPTAEGGVEVLGPRQRADDLARHPPRRPPRTARLRRAVGADGRLRRGDQEGRPDGEGGRLLHRGAGPISSTRPSTGQGQLPNARPTSASTARCRWASGSSRSAATTRKQHGKPLIDVFDFHWYPQGNVEGAGRVHGEGTDRRALRPADALDPRSVGPEVSAGVVDQELRRPADGPDAADSRLDREAQSGHGAVRSASTTSAAATTSRAASPRRRSSASWPARRSTSRSSGSTPRGRRSSAGSCSATTTASGADSASQARRGAADPGVAAVGVRGEASRRSDDGGAREQGPARGVQADAGFAGRGGGGGDVAGAIRIRTTRSPR